MLGEADRFVAETRARFGRLDVLVTSSARNYTAPILETTDEAIEGVFRTNALGPLFAARAAARAFGPAGGAHHHPVGHGRPAGGRGAPSTPARRARSRP